MIFFDNVSKIYPGPSVALDDVSLVIEQGEFASLVGRSGAGKTTLLKLLIREELPTEGHVQVAGHDVVCLRGRELPDYRRMIGTVFQDFRLLPSLTAYENIAFAMEAAGFSDSEIADDVPDVLDVVGLRDKAQHFPSQLSGGERQRVAIGRALAHRPHIIVADEPTGNLDPEQSWDIIALLLRINEMGTTVVMATHDQIVIDRLERRVVVLEGGKIVSDEERGTYQL